MTYKDILGLTTLFQSVRLASENFKESSKEKIDIIGLGVKNIVGTSLIKVQSNLIGLL